MGRKNLEENKANADIFENNLVYLTKSIKNSSKDGVNKTEEINWVKDIVQFILHLTNISLNYGIKKGQVIDLKEKKCITYLETLKGTGN